MYVINYTVYIFCAELIDALMAPGKFPGCSGARNLHDNLADLRAQVAANQRVSFSLVASAFSVS